METIDMTPKDTRQKIELQIADETMSFIIESEDESLYRDVETALNDKVTCIKKAHPHMRTVEALAFLAFQYCLQEQGNKKNNKLLRDFTARLQHFMESIVVDE